MLLSTLGCIVLVLLVTLGLAWPWVARTGLDASEKLLASAGFSLLAVFLLAWTVYVFRLPSTLLWALPVLALAGLWRGRDELRSAAQEPTARSLLICQVLVTAWCVGWLATIRSYSGGAWAADWFEHWERTLFFIERWPENHLFLGRYPLAARPPLANVVTGAFLQLAHVDFAHYQLVTTMLGSLAFLPAATLAARWSGRTAAIPLTAAALMLNPSFVQNATFAWTKLPAAFFVLSAMWFIARAVANEPARSWRLGCSAALLAAGMLAHYSAAPYAVMLGLLYVSLGYKHWSSSSWRREVVRAGAIGLLVLGAWVGWGAYTYGFAETFLSNTSATSAHLREGNQVAKIAANLFDTVVPHFLRPLDTSLIAQSSAWGAWRDWFFQSYQVNLPLALGSVAWLVLAREGMRAGRFGPRAASLFWGSLAVGTAVLGVAVHGARDHWGLAHICLQPLLVLGLAFLASRWELLARGWKLALLLGAAVDFAFGIVLHFGLQSFAIDRWLTPERSWLEIVVTYSEAARMNTAAQLEHRLSFLRDALDLPLAAVGAGLALVFVSLLLVTQHSLKPTPPRAE